MRNIKILCITLSCIALLSSCTEREKERAGARFHLAIDGLEGALSAMADSPEAYCKDSDWIDKDKCVIEMKRRRARRDFERQVRIQKQERILSHD